MFFKIWEVTVNICEPFICFLIFRKKLGIKDKCLVPAILGIFFTAAETTFLNYAQADYATLIIAAFFTYLLYALLVFKGTIWSKVLWTSADIFLVFIANTVVAAATDVIFPASVLISLTWYRFAMTSIYLLVMFLFAPLIMKFNEKDRIMPLYIKISIVVLCLFGSVSLYLLTEHMLFLSENGLSVITCAVVSYISVALILSVLVLFDKVSKAAKEKYDAQVALTKANAEIEYINQVSAVIDTFREIKHDYASHITAISAYAKDGDLDSLQKYLSELNTQYGIEKYFISTGNRTFDSIVTSKALICSSRGIAFDTYVLLPPSLPFSDVEIAGLFGNLLDNAIEAQNNVGGDKSIILEVNTKGRMLCITVKNTSGGNYIYKDNELATTNSDRESHGLGLKRIKAIASAHGGSFDVTPEKDRFTAQILVPLEM